MYKIIGADQKEYGPVSGDQLRQWLKEGRVDGQTRVCAEGSDLWQPLSAFPEFAAVPGGGFPAATPLSPAPLPTDLGGGREAALQKIKAPAIALIVTAILGIAYYVFSGLFTLVAGGSMLHRDMPSNVPPEMRAFLANMQGPLAGVISLGIAALDGFVLWGAIKLMRLQSHGIALAACIAAMLPCQCCCVLGLPFGIWALVVMNKPEVKSHFN